MDGDVLAGVRIWQWAVVGLGLLGSIGAQAASAADCPGHPDALGTSRTLVVDPKAHPRIGSMQYPETLPLEDHEVVLTFDDGPLPRNSNQVLDILASQCVKATFFTIGKMAQAYSEGVRKLRDAGQTIGTHTQDHPLSMDRMTVEQARQEIEDGIASVKAALGDGTAPAPFFRIPGLLRGEGVEDYLASQGIQIWSADFLADDWRHISSSRVYELAIKRLEDRGKGILLLHDIQARTVAALPRILNELKARGFRIVQVVPATPDRPATPTEPEQWLSYPASETVATARWPKVPGFDFAHAGMLPAPAMSDLDLRDGQVMMLAEPFDRVKGLLGGAPGTRHALWPQPSPPAPDSAATTLPVAASSVFELQEGFRVAERAFALPARHAELVSEHEEAISRKHSHNGRMMRGKPHPGHIRQAAGHAAPHPAHAHHGPLKHLVQVRKRSV
jgi:peptidoglycan/xylan/chitin deacetylase (PgdA/CDA1 family)